MDTVTEEIDQAILEAGFRPVPFRHFLDPFAKYLPGFLRPRQEAASLTPKALKLRQRKLPPTGRPSEDNANDDGGAPTPDHLGALPAAMEKGRRAIKSPDRLLATVQTQAAGDKASGRIFRLPFPLALTSAACLVTGVLIGHVWPEFVDRRPSPSAVSALADKASRTPASAGLSPAEEESLDAACAARKSGKYTEAKQLFLALRTSHPEWTSMDAAIGTTELYEGDPAAAKATFEALMDRAPNSADANFRMGVLLMTQSVDNQAEKYFAAATASDPSRPEYYCFWGECLRNQGKPLEAAARFRSALLRNEFDPANSFYRLKFWLCQIEADLETQDGTSTQIEAAISRPNPPMEALVAVAAQNIKAGNFKAAAQRLVQARALVGTTFYAVILKDPIFRQEQSRPEMAQAFATSPEK